MKANPRYLLARVSPQEILVSAGPFGREYMEISFEAPQTCQFAYDLFETLTRSPMPREEIIRLFQEKGHDLAILEQLEKIQVLLPDSAGQIKPRAFLVKNGQGLLAQALQHHLEALGFAAEVVSSVEGVQEDSVLIAAFDHWIPRDLRDLEAHVLCSGGSFLPVVYIAEGAFIGPYVTRQTARYEDFEIQFDASLFSWIGWRSFREMMIADKGSGGSDVLILPLPHVEFVASFAAMLTDRHLRTDNDLLANKVILVDLTSFYIEDVRIYRVHASQARPRMEI